MPTIEIDGSSMRAGFFEPGLWINAPASTLRGLAIHNFPSQGVVLGERSGGCLVEDNCIGTDGTGTVDKGNAGSGLQIHSSPNNTIRGNVISGNGESGIFIVNFESTGNRVEGNSIGTDFSGINRLRNDLTGVALGQASRTRDGVEFPGIGYPSANFIGGPGAGNVISGNANSGVLIDRGERNSVQGNRIGVTADGAMPLPNGDGGLPEDEGDYGIDGVYINEGRDNLIGGTAPNAGNVISANKGAGVIIRALTQSATGNRIHGNQIGTNDDGAGSGLGNQRSGVEIRNESDPEALQVVVSDNAVGGVDLEDGAADGNVTARNIISGNFEHGVLVAGHRTHNNRIQGNFIGTDVTGTRALPNGNGGPGGPRTGVSVSGLRHLVGGAGPGEGNLISGNGSGLSVSSLSSDRGLPASSSAATLSAPTSQAPGPWATAPARAWASASEGQGASRSAGHGPASATSSPVPSPTPATPTRTPSGGASPTPTTPTGRSHRARARRSTS